MLSRSRICNQNIELLEIYETGTAMMATMTKKDLRGEFSVVDVDEVRENEWRLPLM